VASVGITAGEHISLGIIATVKSLTSRLWILGLELSYQLIKK
jgi:hypothetical protein